MTVYAENMPPRLLWFSNAVNGTETDSRGKRRDLDVARSIEVLGDRDTLHRPGRFPGRDYVHERGPSRGLSPTKLTVRV
jgi:hypothetical protein